MRATAFLRKEHRDAIRLFRRYERANRRLQQMKLELFGQIKSALEAHTQVVHDIFYSAVADAPSEHSTEAIREARELSRVMESLIEDLSLIDPRDIHYDGKVKALRDCLERLIWEEEKVVFQEARTRLNAERLQELGMEMAARRKVFLDRLDAEKILNQRSRMLNTWEAGRRS